MSAKTARNQMDLVSLMMRSKSFVVCPNNIEACHREVSASYATTVATSYTRTYGAENSE